MSTAKKANGSSNSPAKRTNASEDEDEAPERFLYDEFQRMWVKAATRGIADGPAPVSLGPAFETHEYYVSVGAQRAKAPRVCVYDVALPEGLTAAQCGFTFTRRYGWANTRSHAEDGLQQWAQTIVTRAPPSRPGFSHNVQIGDELLLVGGKDTTLCSEDVVDSLLASTESAKLRFRLVREPRWNEMFQQHLEARAQVVLLRSNAAALKSWLLSLHDLVHTFVRASNALLQQPRPRGGLQQSEILHKLTSMARRSTTPVPSCETTIDEIVVSRGICFSPCNQQSCTLQLCRHRFGTEKFAGNGIRAARYILQAPFNSAFGSFDSEQLACDAEHGLPRALGIAVPLQAILHRGGYSVQVQPLYSSTGRSEWVTLDPTDTKFFSGGRHECDVLERACAPTQHSVRPRVCLMANWQDARVVAALYHDLVPRDMPSNARGRSNVGDVNLLFEGYGLFVSARHEYGFRQVLVADSRAAAMESQDLARQVLQQLHVHAPFLPDSGSQCYQHLDDVVEALIGNHLIPSLQSEMSRDFAVGALYGSTDDSLTPLSPKLVQRLRPLLIPIEDCPVVGGCCAAIVGFAKPNVANSDNSVSGVTGDCDSTFDAELKVLSRAQMPNTRASQLTDLPLYGDAAIVFYRNTSSANDLVHRVRGERGISTNNSHQTRVCEVANILCRTAQQTCSFGSHAIVVSPGLVDDDGNDVAFPQTFNTDLVFFGVYRALPLGKQYNGGLVFQLDGAEAFLYFSRRRHHWVIGPGPLPIETMQTEAFKGGEYEKKMHEQERQLGFWAEYDAKAGPLASPAFPSRFDPSRWSCWTGSSRELPTGLTQTIKVTWYAADVAVYSHDTARAASLLPVGSECHRHGLNLRYLGQLRTAVNGMLSCGGRAEEVFVVGMLRTPAVECVRKILLGEMVARTCVKWIRACLLGPKQKPNGALPDAAKLQADDAVRTRTLQLLQMLQGCAEEAKHVDSRAANTVQASSSLSSLSVAMRTASDWATSDLFPRPKKNRRGGKKRTSSTKKFESVGDALGPWRDSTDSHVHEQPCSYVKQHEESPGSGKCVGSLTTHFFWTVYVKVLLLAKYGPAGQRSAAVSSNKITGGLSIDNDSEYMSNPSGLSALELDASFDLRLALRGLGWYHFWHHVWRALSLDVRQVSDQSVAVTASMVAAASCASSLPAVGSHGSQGCLTNCVVKSVDRDGSAKTPLFTPPSQSALLAQAEQHQKCSLKDSALFAENLKHVTQARAALTARMQRQQHALAHCQAQHKAALQKHAADSSQVFEAARQVEHLRTGLCRTVLGLVGVLRVERFHRTKVKPETFLIRNDHADVNEPKLSAQIGQLLKFDSSPAAAIRLALHWRDERGNAAKAETLLRTILKKSGRDNSVPVDPGPSISKDFDALSTSRLTTPRAVFLGLVTMELAKTLSWCRRFAEAKTFFTSACETLLHPPPTPHEMHWRTASATSVAHEQNLQRNLKTALLRVTMTCDRHIDDSDVPCKSEHDQAALARSKQPAAILTWRSPHVAAFGCMHAFAQSRIAAGDSAEALGILTSAMRVLNCPEHGAINILDPGESSASSFDPKSQHWYAADISVARALLLRKTSDAWLTITTSCRPAQQHPPRSTPATADGQRALNAACEASSCLNHTITRLRSHLLTKFTALRAQEATCANCDKGGAWAGLDAACLTVGDDGTDDSKSSICQFATLLPLQRPQCQLLARLLVQRARLLLAFGKQNEGVSVIPQESNLLFGGNGGSHTPSTLPRTQVQSRAARIIAGACRIAFCAAYGTVPAGISVCLASSFGDISRSPTDHSAGSAASGVSDSFQDESPLEPPLGFDELFGIGQACVAVDPGAADVLSQSGGADIGATLPAILLEAGVALTESVHNPAHSSGDESNVELGKYLLRQSVALSAKCSGGKHSMVADGLYSLAKVAGQATDQQERDRRFQLHLQAYDIRRGMLIDGHPDIAASQHALGQLKYQAGDLQEARHWLENAFRSRTAACVEGYVLNGPPVLETAVLLTKVLERSAMDALAKQLDWSVLKKFYLRGAEVCQQAFKLVDEVYTRPMATRTQGEILGEKQEEVLVASEKTATSTAIGPAVTARMYWHAAVVTSWQLDHRGAWHLLREGVEARSGKGVLNRVAEADVILHIPQKDRDVDVFGKPIYEWARDLQAKFETAE